MNITCESIEYIRHYKLRSGKGSQFRKYFLENLKEKLQTVNKFSLERDILVGVSNGSIDALLLFSLCLNGLTPCIYYSLKET